jgi:hypothetical protein
MKKYIIEDWAGNHLFKNKTFNSFDEGRQFIWNNVDNSVFDRTQNDDDDEHQDYFVV